MAMMVEMVIKVLRGLKLLKFSTITTIITISTISTLYAQDSLNVHLLYHWNDTTIPFSNWVNSRYSDCWGVVQGGREYAVIGGADGTHIIDITDIPNAHQVAYVPGDVQVTVIHREYKDYHGYLYAVCDEGASKLQIIDLHHLPDSVSLVYHSDTIFSRAHDIFIDTLHAKLYACGGATGNTNNELLVLSLADPVNPTLLVNCGQQVSYWDNSIMPIGYIHDIYVRNDTAFCNAGYNGMFVVDFSNTTNPVVLGSLTSYPYKGYNHSGWLRDTGWVYAMADENYGYKLKMVDVHDFSNISVIDTFGSGVDSLSIPHNPIFRGNYLYVSYYQDGLYVFNTDNPHHVYIHGFYRNSTIPHGHYGGAWGVYPLLPSGKIIISDMQNGLYIFRVDLPSSGIEEHHYNNALWVFPSPFSNYFNISYNKKEIGEIAGVDYELIDESGRMVLTGNAAQSFTRLSTAGLRVGLYMLKLTAGKRIFEKKMIKVN